MVRAAPAALAAASPVVAVVSRWLRLVLILVICVVDLLLEVREPGVDLLLSVEEALAQVLLDNG